MTADQTTTAPACGPTRQDPGDLHCVSQDPREPAGPGFLAVCDDNPAHIERSVRCEPECGGHPICDPCHTLAVAIGLVRRETKP